ncbi:hypothetical protein F4780DRAFT_545977 [Xylariomycetidae sp. FL0641]|nr:hypothetical protein F4780DRAFT_545977 [Xylariomycetidae sp. FL0641]
MAVAPVGVTHCKSPTRPIDHATMVVPRKPLRLPTATQVAMKRHRRDNFALRDEGRKKVASRLRGAELAQRWPRTGYLDRTSRILHAQLPGFAFPADVRIGARTLRNVLEALQLSSVQNGEDRARVQSLLRTAFRVVLEARDQYADATEEALAHFFFRVTQRVIADGVKGGGLDRKQRTGRLARLRPLATMELVAKFTLARDPSLDSLASKKSKKLLRLVDLWRTWLHESATGLEHTDIGGMDLDS